MAGEVIDNYMKFRDANGIRGSWVILDEITFVDEWHRAIKRRIDDGIFGRDVLIISGSASIELLRAKESFPGRRGKGKDLIFYPLSFSDYVSSIKGVELPKGGLDEIEGLMGASAIHRDVLEGASAGLRLLCACMGASIGASGCGSSARSPGTHRCTSRHRPCTP